MADFHDLTTVQPFVVDFSLGAFDGTGGIPAEGLYEHTVKNFKVMPAKDGTKVPQLTCEVHLDGTDGFRYAYVSLPVNPNHDHYKNHQRDLITFVLCHRPDLAAQLQGQMQITADFLRTLEGARGKCYFIPPEQDEKGKVIVGSKDEITFLTAERAAAIKADASKAPKRRMSTRPQTVGAGSLGAVPSAMPSAVPSAIPAAVPSAIPTAAPSAMPPSIPAAIPQPPTPPVVPLPPR